MSTFSPSDFRKSSWSNPDKNCVEVAMNADVVEVRDSKTTFGAANDHRLRMSPAAFAAFLAVVAGETERH